MTRAICAARLSRAGSIADASALLVGLLACGQLSRRADHNRLRTYNLAVLGTLVVVKAHGMRRGLHSLKVHYPTTLGCFSRNEGSVEDTDGGLAARPR